MIIVLGLLFILVCWIYYEKNKSTKQTKTKSDTFWEKEQKSMTTRSKDLSSLQFLKIPVEQLPFDKGTSAELLDLHNEIKALSTQEIVNLQGMSNTDLRLTFGAPNFNRLSIADNNYIKLVRLLNKWGKLLYENGFEQESICVLTYSIDCNTDVSSSYTLLASIYVKQQEPEKIMNLIQKAEQLNSMTSGALLNSLRDTLAACYINSEKEI